MPTDPTTYISAAFHARRRSTTEIAMTFRPGGWPPRRRTVLEWLVGFVIGPSALEAW